MVRGGAPEGALEVHRSAFMRYRGQGHEIEIGLPDQALAVDDLPNLVRRFEDAYRGQFARSVPVMTIEILNWAVRVATAAQPPQPIPPVATARPARPSCSRDCCCDRTGKAIEIAIYPRETLRPGDTLTGPALIVEPQTTTLVSAEFTARVDGALKLILTREEAKA